MDGGVDDAVRALLAGRLVVYPTDTLYGLGARAEDPRAVARLIALKGRAPEQPISVAVSAFDDVEPLAALTPPGRRFLRTHLPGPFTLLVPPTGRARRAFPPAIAGGRALGLRIPDHPLARELARRVGPLTATSANRHGAPPATSLAAARKALGDGVAVYLGLGPRPAGRPSELVDLTGPEPRAVPRR
jgi:L-threonylcarbamoyladenylate synthase